MPVFHKPKYPIVIPNPTVGQAILNFNLSDIGALFAFSAGGYATGWFGASKLLRGRNAKFLLLAGVFAGFSYGVQRSSQRLIGLEPNAREVALHGVASKEELDEYERFAINGNLEQIETPKHS